MLFISWCTIVGWRSLDHSNVVSTGKISIIALVASLKASEELELLLAVTVITWFLLIIVMLLLLCGIKEKIGQNNTTSLVSRYIFKALVAYTRDMALHGCGTRKLSIFFMNLMTFM